VRDDAGEPSGGTVSVNNNSPTHSVGTTSVSAGTPTGTVTVNSNGGDEARPDSFGFTGLIKL
jgi:hypothetical protein